MKKLLLAVLLVLDISAANASPLPDGCYVTYSNPMQCFYPTGGDMSWIAGDFALLLDHYGPAMALMIDWRNNDRTSCAAAMQGLQDQLNICNSSQAGTASELTRCGNDYNGLVNKYNSLVAPYNKNLALIKKLRKACGVKCKKIK